MHFFASSKGAKIQSRRALSQILASLLLLAIVVPIGTVILINGTSEINAFNNEVKNSAVYQNDGIREDVVFEHIRFDPGSTQVMISLRNAGSVETIIDSVTIVNMTGQDLIFKIAGLGSFDPVILPLKNSTDFEVTGINVKGGSWSNAYQDQEYKVSIITSRGNFFDTVARPFNT